MGIRKLIGQTLRRISAALLPLIAYFTLVFGRRRRPTVEADTSILEVRDRGSDVTLVSFAGLAALHGGMVNYEFTNLLRRHGLEANLVFVRDPLLACYHLAPDGGTDGIAYYEGRVREALEKLGSRYNVAIGTSIGGMAALLFAQRCGMDRVLAFSPSWPPERYLLNGSLSVRLRRWKVLFRHPGAFFERLILGQMARISQRTLKRTVGEGAIVDLEAEMKRARRLPKITVYYGEGCDPDVITAGALREAGAAETVALPTAMHNTTAFLKQRGDLVNLILDTVEEGMVADGLTPVKSVPPPAFEPQTEDVTTFVARTGS
ncbi:MAG: hypothetical protein U0230_21195 [Polyangiales bacterium]